MAKKILSAVSSLVLVLLVFSSSIGFDSNANKDESTSDPNDQRAYTRENAAKPVGQGGYYGGHDTITK